MGWHTGFWRGRFARDELLAIKLSAFASDQLIRLFVRDSISLLLGSTFSLSPEQLERRK